MPAEIVGMIGTQEEARGGGPAVHVSTASSVSPEHIVRFARVHEESGFDSVLIGYRATTADGFAVAGYAANHTSTLGFLIAHRPGFVQPTLAARHAATLDQLTGGRISLHIITGGSDADQQRDGDFVDHDMRYRRTAEYMDVLRRVWTSGEPFDYEGEFYRFAGAYSQVKPVQEPHIPLSFGGASGPAVDVGAQYADVYALWGEPLEGVRERIAEIREASARFGRSPRIHVSLRPVLGDTEGEAWDRAHDILGRTESARPGEVLAGVENEGSRRLLDFAARSDVHDERLWMPLAAATGAAGNTTALVGTAEQVVDSLMRYYELGVTTFLIRGFEPFEDAIDYGRQLIPMLRARVEARDRAG
jgi:alkanesulfonate monooxygenase